MNLQQAYYEQRFEIAFLRAKGEEFQTFFERLMGLAYKADFIACPPWGNIGDRKNDGFLKSERRLFQVYAPNEMTASKAVDKITEDFEGAKVHWGMHFDKWSFVHNAVDGLSPSVQKLMLELESANPGVSLESWGLEELRLVFRLLSLDDLAGWLGPAPTEESRNWLGFGDIQLVLESLVGKAVPAGTEIRTVPRGKIEANALCESVATLIKAGMTKGPLVSHFFETWHDETLGERLAVAVRDQYNKVRLQFPPNWVFAELQEWVGGSKRGTPEHEMAVFALIAYYFERCDIFEESKESRP
jgi:hypothetical protein